MGNTPNKDAKKETARCHQPGQSVFKSILPEQIDWKPFPAFPPSARLAIVVGQPLQEGPYTIRVKVPRGVKLMPHRHPEDRVYTVISGTFYIGLGDEFDTEKLQAYPPGAVIILPGNTSHFHWAKSGEYITQVTAIGPLGLEYINAKDDPRSKGAKKMKSTNDVIDHHLKAIKQGDVDAVLSDYAPDAVLFREDGLFKGADAIRLVFEAFVAEFQKPGTTVSTKQRLVEGDYAYMVWTAETADNVYELATDTFFVEQGQIVAQSFTAKIRPKRDLAMA